MFQPFFILVICGTVETTVSEVHLNFQKLNLLVLWN